MSSSAYAIAYMSARQYQYCAFACMWALVCGHVCVRICEGALLTFDCMLTERGPQSVIKMLGAVCE